MSDEHDSDIDSNEPDSTTTTSWTTVQMNAFDKKKYEQEQRRELQEFIDNSSE